MRDGDAGKFQVLTSGALAIPGARAACVARPSRRLPFGGVHFVASIRQERLTEASY